MRKVDPTSTVWQVIGPHIEERMKALRDRICGGNVRHEEGSDAENRARLRELEKLVTDLTKEPTNE